MNRKERRLREKKSRATGRQQVNVSVSKEAAAKPNGSGADGGALYSFATGSPIESASLPPDEELQKASNLLSNGMVSDAIESCQLLNQSYPNNIEVQYLSGVAHYMNGNSESAIHCFEFVSSNNPQNAEVHIYLSNLELEQNDLAKAEAHIRNAVALLPEDQDILQQFGYILQRRDKMLEAADVYRKLLEKMPNSAEILLNYGYALYRTEEIDRAIEQYRKAIKISPNLGQAYLNLGLALSEKGENDEAIEAFQTGLDFIPEHVDGLFGFARCLRTKNEFSTAAETFQKALSLASDRTLEYWELGYCLELSGDKKSALDAYEKCLAHNPDHSVARHLLDALAGNISETAPKEYVTELFDDYAESFDENLVKDLGYVTPKILADYLTSLNLLQPIRSVLDLGGGTGLIAEEIMHLVDTTDGLVHGVDLSSRMLDVANHHQRYSETFVSDIQEFLDGSQGVSEYELVIAGDVYVYIGKLDSIIAGVYRRLTKNGRFIFTVEKSTAEDYVLQSSGRFAHHQNYIENCAGKAGFKVSHVDEITPRKDDGKPIQGYLFCLKK